MGKQLEEPEVIYFIRSTIDQVLQLQQLAMFHLPIELVWGGKLGYYRYG